MDSSITPSSPDALPLPIGTIEPEPEIQSVVHNCEPLGPDPELEMMPLGKEAPPAIGAGVTPIIEEEKESNNNEVPTKSETPEPEEHLQEVKQELEEKLEELAEPEKEQVEEEAHQEMEEPMVVEHKERLLNKLLESEEFQGEFIRGRQGSSEFGIVTSTRSSIFFQKAIWIFQTVYNSKAAAVKSDPFPYCF